MAAPDGMDATGITRARLESLSDGVIAVAITLLVLGIDPPSPADGQSLWDALDSGTIGSLLLFVLSFAVIARFWMVHHDAVRTLPATVPAPLVAANFAFLLTICLIPFSTTLFARNADDMLALIVYATAFALVSALLGVIAQAGGAAWRRKSLVISAVFLLAIPIGLAIGPNYAPCAWALLFLLSFDGIDRRIAPPDR